MKERNCQNDSNKRVGCGNDSNDGDFLTFYCFIEEDVPQSREGGSTYSVKKWQEPNGGIRAKEKPCAPVD